MANEEPTAYSMREIPGASPEAMAPRDKFLYCMNISNLAEGCCCCCTLKIGVMIISVLTIINGVLDTLAFLSYLNYLNAFMAILLILEASGIYFGVQGYVGAANSLPLKTKLFYRWVFILFLLYPILFGLSSIWTCDEQQMSGTNTDNNSNNIKENTQNTTNTNTTNADQNGKEEEGLFGKGPCYSPQQYIFNVFLNSAIATYCLFIIFSHYNRLLMGQVVLVNNGKDVVDLMRNIRVNQQPRNVQLQPIEGIIVGHPVEPNPVPYGQSILAEPPQDMGVH